MPVSNIAGFVTRSVSFGASRWIGRWSSDLIGAAPSLASPSTFIRRPRHARPTGTVIGAPVSSTAVPRVSPSVAPIAIVRTMLSPRWLATSTVSVAAPPLPSWGILIFKAL